LRALRGGRSEAVVDEEELLKLVLLAYPDRVCVRRENNPLAATMVGGFGVKIAADSVVSAPLFVAVDARDETRLGTREATARMLSEVRVEWIEELFPQALREQREVAIDESSGRVRARVAVLFADLAIAERVDHQASAQDVAVALAGLARQQARAIFRADPEAEQVLQRLAFLRHHMPERGWPAMSDDMLGELLARSCMHKRSIQQLREQDLRELLLSDFDWQQRQQLDELAPTHITVPSGSRIRLSYNGDRQPVLAVRLQEIFGWLQTPRIAGGRLPVVMELLGPNFRPVQVTSDLASFWQTTYFQVRKDMRVRYPKHAWPEDPMAARPEAKGRPRPR